MFPKLKSKAQERKEKSLQRFTKHRLCKANHRVKKMVQAFKSKEHQKIRKGVLINAIDQRHATTMVSRQQFEEIKQS